jgi:hypothetical protein
MGGKERFLSLTAGDIDGGSPMYDGAGSLRRRTALLLATNGALRRVPLRADVDVRRSGSTITTTRSVYALCSRLAAMPSSPLAPHARG